MNAICALLLVSLAAEPIEIEMKRVADPAAEQAEGNAAAAHARAVVLLQGLRPRPFSSKNVSTALFHGWQEPDSYLVKDLSRDYDVYAISYSQNADIQDIAAHPLLARDFAALKQQGYRAIIVVAHSAGGVIAREFIEDHPDCGVTKLIQTSAPNLGSGWAGADWFVRYNQEVFLHSLTKEGRHRHLAARANKKFPPQVEMVCVVGRLDIEVETRQSRRVFKERWLQALITRRYRGDSVVACVSQWPDDLQEQGIPAVVVPLDHYALVRSQAGAETIARLVRQPQPRWDAAAVRAARPQILGTGDAASVHVFYHESRPHDDGIRVHLAGPSSGQ